MTAIHDSEFKFSMAEEKAYLNAKDFEDIPGSAHAHSTSTSLKVLDVEVGKDVWLGAFAPIKLVTAGGYLAVRYLKNRESTGDLDYLIEPEFAGDADIKSALDKVVISVARRLDYPKDWLNEAMAIFVTRDARGVLFERAKKQGITLFDGENLQILAAPIEWALERKLRRIYNGNRDRKAVLDMGDAIALLKYMRERNKGPLDLESIRTMNLNGFDVVPDHATMQRVADEYRRTCNEDIFQ
ncbi:hypothetical protein BJY04DRAFT_221517 [Aspergillus karnatakaensis]|uniref:uncharacterized protein n=1 Tax=Aspergillus karnatakaensis TaxID=1810916 RepID=UPI003CCDB5A5